MKPNLKLEDVKDTNRILTMISNQSKIRTLTPWFKKLIIGFILSLNLFCASLSNYIQNRGNDLADVVNVGIEKDVYGFNVDFLIPLPALSYNANGKGLGIRHGHIGFYKTGDGKNLVRMINKKLDVEYEIYVGNSYF